MVRRLETAEIPYFSFVFLNRASDVRIISGVPTKIDLLNVEISTNGRSIVFYIFSVSLPKKGRKVTICDNLWWYKWWYKCRKRVEMHCCINIIINLFLSILTFSKLTLYICSKIVYNPVIEYIQIGM